MGGWVEVDVVKRRNGEVGRQVGRRGESKGVGGGGSGPYCFISSPPSILFDSLASTV